MYVHVPSCVNCNPQNIFSPSLVYSDEFSFGLPKKAKNRKENFIMLYCVCYCMILFKYPHIYLENLLKSNME